MVELFKTVGGSIDRRGREFEREFSSNNPCETSIHTGLASQISAVGPIRATMYAEKEKPRILSIRGQSHDFLLSPLLEDRDTSEKDEQRRTTTMGTNCWIGRKA